MCPLPPPLECYQKCMWPTLALLVFSEVAKLERRSYRTCADDKNTGACMANRMQEKISQMNFMQKIEFVCAGK